MTGADKALMQGGDGATANRFHLLLDTLPFIAFVIAPEGQAQYYNQRFITYHGFRPGPEPDARTGLLHAEDQPRLLDARRTAAPMRQDYIVEARLRRHDGAYRWHRIHNKPLLEDGALIGWLGTAVDIHDVVHANAVLEERVRERTAALATANERLIAEIEQHRKTEEGLRASKARYRLLYNRTPMALQSVDRDARLIDVNDIWLAMFGYERHQVLGRSPPEFMTQTSATRYQTEAWPQMLGSAGALRVMDYQFVTRAGRVFDGRLAAAGEFDGDGRFIRSWSAISDVTAEKRAARELRQAQRMEAIGQLAAGIAHDFNNLLTAILGNLELLAKWPSQNPNRIDRLLRGAQAAAERGAKLTGQLLAFSRKQQITTQPVDLNRLLQGMAPLLQSTIGGTIGIEIKLKPDITAALADPTQLELAILNLVLNARDAMPDGGTLTLETADVVIDEPTQPEEPAAGSYVAVRVADTGQGIPDALRERIFEPFFTTKDVGSGSGLGLPQVLGVAKQLGGGIGVRSSSDTGTCVSIFLPPAGRAAAAIAQPAQSDAGTTAPVAAVRSGMTPAGTETESAAPTAERPARILLVDDDADVRSTAAEMLADAGYMVAEAPSGAAALDALERAENRTDLVLADVAMPGINGVEFAAIVRRTWPALPVLLMTGYADTKLLRQYAGQEVLQKPFEASTLHAKVRSALAH